MTEAAVEEPNTRSTIGARVRGNTTDSPYPNACRAEFKLPHPIFKKPFGFLWASAPDVPGSHGNGMAIVMAAIPEPLRVLTEAELLSTIPNNTILHNNGVLTGDCVLPPDAVDGYRRPFVAYWERGPFLCCYTNVFAVGTLGPVLAGHLSISAEFIEKEGAHNWLAEARLLAMKLDEAAIKARKDAAKEREMVETIRGLAAAIRTTR